MLQKFKKLFVKLLLTQYAKNLENVHVVFKLCVFIYVAVVKKKKNVSQNVEGYLWSFTLFLEADEAKDNKSAKSCIEQVVEQITW